MSDEARTDGAGGGPGLTAWARPWRMLVRQLPAQAVGIAAGLLIARFLFGASGTTLVIAFVLVEAISVWQRRRCASRPAVVVDADGLQLPLIGTAVAWADVCRSTPQEWRRPALLVFPQDAEAVLAQVRRRSVRRVLRATLGRFGTPITIDARHLDKSLEEIEAAVAACRLHAAG